MTIHFTGMHLTSGEEPPELLKQLAFEYLAELSRLGMIQLLETVGKKGEPVILAIIPNAKVEAGVIVGKEVKKP